MRTLVAFLLLMALAAALPARAQRSTAQACAQLFQLTKLFDGDAPFACSTITEIKYKTNANRPLRDTSKVIYRNHRTYYRSRRVEHVEGAEGELLVNHELRTVSLYLSDSIRRKVQETLDVKRDPETEALLETAENAEKADLSAFKTFLIDGCNATWETKGGVEEIRFTAKVASQAPLLSVVLEFRDGKILYYEYTYRDVYANDYYGNSRFRFVRNIYQNFDYEDIPAIPAHLSDFLQWNGWTIKLKKYTDYELSVL